jgi:hypothetical protein
MSRVRRVHDCVALLLMAVALLFVTTASSQLSQEDKQRVIALLSAQIDRAIAEHEKDDGALREKVVGRLIQCGGAYSILSKQANAGSDASKISYELSALVSKGVGLDRFKEIGNAAQKSLNDKFAAKRTPDSEREMQALFMSCKSLQTLAEVSDAVAELLTTSARRDASSIQFAKELQECSLYYLLLAGASLTEVPNTGRLSPADSKKAAQGMAYQTRSEQIELVYKRLALLAGMTDAALKARAETMFENQKLLMGPKWDVAKLHERYKTFCEFALGNAGGKERVQEIARGNMCQGLYKCW